MRRSLYDSIGGFGTISKIVLSFYGKVLESEDAAPYFADVDMQQLIDHQTKFICSLLGGPASFTDDQIRLAHRSINVTDDAFNHIAALFVEALNDAKLPAADIDAIAKAFEAKRPLIVPR
ncbi:truncated hemoglobin [Pseudorhodoplanes sinuspersici]|uniref:Group 1 truncated hemoglobin n=1 Tax=Pseudorhodoplanes sinuspersici TaxID=1235591 RepID=A0A1W6ZX74_9HYPH|nr:group 1 truncated hemoglobin [Pseudorhodoplanes sinuspersici]ARQ01741.1 group 1 truncated hemoglobin [Pseudorhodoplanes sinuspersici]RKE73483.1 hemoglobin [Pseudorhodoplanes sinuspersici]